ncbi:hypothetical protein PQS31_01670 [Luteimonas sp BLCC-B24]|uniref:hypothetical protein n=1 Tax=Luteimonas sp. BLCC-B24 TaxID=3025317 RepID=UPI00234DC3D3|nr:hypothetical protein [Luteimonas sp. BLCC-B24]MDC7805539.1 hypothetical protein [Luteimonas sp. BLCC-B24]
MRVACAIAVLVLAGCAGRAPRAEAPLITPCLDAPTAYIPDEPEAPADGAPIPDSYVVALKGWANSLLGVVTQDRIAWRGERRCIRRFQEAGQIR